jgi:hypothetical protein
LISTSDLVIKNQLRMPFDENWTVEVQQPITTTVPPFSTPLGMPK